MFAAVSIYEAFKHERQEENHLWQDSKLTVHKLFLSSLKDLKQFRKVEKAKSMRV